MISNIKYVQNMTIKILKIILNLEIFVKTRRDVKKRTNIQLVSTPMFIQDWLKLFDTSNNR